MSAQYDHGVAVDTALLDQLIADLAGSRPTPVPPWSAPVRLRPLAAPRAAAAWPGPRPLARPAAIAATALLTGGLLASVVGARPLVAAESAASPAMPAASLVRLAPAAGALAGLTLAPAAPNETLLARLLAAPVKDDTALLVGLFAAEPVALPGFELVDGPAAAAPAAPPTLSFATVAKLPAAVQSYELAPVGLPAVTIADQERANALNTPPPPPPPPVNNSQNQQQPPPPPGYVQPPGYQDGVPFGGQIGAVPGSQPARPSRPSGGGTGTVVRPVQAVHIVQAGETLSVIAVRYYGNARYADLIWEANIRVIGFNPNVIVPGQRLVLPGIFVRPPAARPPANLGPLPTTPIASRSTYTIQPRDFLRWMSQRAYGNERFWPEIYNANRNVLGPNPDLIYPGVRVFIP